MRPERAEERGNESPSEVMELPGATTYPSSGSPPLHWLRATDISAPTPRDSRVILKGELRPLGAKAMIPVSQAVSQVKSQTPNPDATRSGVGPPREYGSWKGTADFSNSISRMCNSISRVWEELL